MNTGCEQLLGQKADLLFEFLQVTKEISKLFEKVEKKFPNPKDWMSNEAFAVELERYIKKRDEVAKKVDGVDTQIKDRVSKGHCYSPKEEKKIWLCKKMLTDIIEEQKSQAVILEELYEGSTDKLKTVNGSIKGYRAYNFLDARKVHSKEWKK